VQPTQTPFLNNHWKQTWGLISKRHQIVYGTGIMLAVVFTLPSFFNYIQKRHGVFLNDWLLALIPPHNVSIAIFSIIWGMGLLIIYRAVHNPQIYINYCWTLILVSILRIITISLIPLDPPAGLINLTDPLTGIFYGESLITKDLFFSGHTATLTLIFLCLEKRSDKYLGLLAIIIVAVLLLVQHIHYTMDIIAAPFFVYACFLFIRNLLKD
jgi:hypothetical protein